MGQRFTEESRPPRVPFMHTWGNKVGTGRWYKRQLSKARRRFGKALVRYGEQAYRHAGCLAGVESETSWRGW